MILLEIISVFGIFLKDEVYLYLYACLITNA